MLVHTQSDRGSGVRLVWLTSVYPPFPPSFAFAFFCQLWLKPSSAFFDKVGPLPRKDDEQDYLLHEGDHDKDEDKEDDDDDDDYDDKPKTATGT